MTNAEYREQADQLNEELRAAHDKIKELEQKITELRKLYLIGWNAEDLP